MALDLSGFVAPEQKFEWISKIGENIAGKQKAKAVAAQLAKEEEQKKATKQEASTKYFQDYISQQYKFTGTKYDDVARELTDNALNTAKDLISKGAEWSTVNNVVSPMVKTLNDYSFKAQAYDKNKKETAAQYKDLAGVNYNELLKGSDQLAFAQGIEGFDPSKNYVEMAAATLPNIYNTGAFDVFAHMSGNKDKTGVKTSYKDEKGKSVTKNLTVEKQNYLIPENDSQGNNIGFVPKYQIATDNGADIIGKFFTEKGVEEHPVRMLDEQIFESFKQDPKLSPMYGYSFQEANKYAQANGIPLTDPKVKMLAKAIAYDELNVQHRKSPTVLEGQQIIEPKISVSVAGSKPTQAEIKESEDVKSLIKTFSAKTPDANGYYEATSILGSIPLRTESGITAKKYKNIKFNPETQTIIWTPSNTTLSPMTMSVDEAISSVDSESDRAKLRRLKSVRVSKPTTTQKVKAGVKKAVQKGKGWLDKALGG